MLYCPKQCDFKPMCQTCKLLKLEIQYSTYYSMRGDSDILQKQLYPECKILCVFLPNCTIFQIVGTDTMTSFLEFPSLSWCLKKIFRV